MKIEQELKNYCARKLIEAIDTFEATERLNTAMKQYTAELGMDLPIEEHLRSLRTLTTLINIKG